MVLLEEDRRFWCPSLPEMHEAREVARQNIVDLPAVGDVDFTWSDGFEVR